MTAGWNWARTHRFRATQIHTPRHTDELLDSIAAATTAGTSVRCVGTRHSFTGVADGDTLLDLSQLPEQFEIAADRSTVSVSAAITYARLAELLAPARLAVANLASLPHITIAGAIATATHGSGDHNGNLATQVRALTIATSNGELRRIADGEVGFGAGPTSVGALGAVVAVELATEPAFDIEQVVHDDLSWSSVIGSFDAIFGSAHSVSLFTDWRDHLELWTKRRVDGAEIDHASLHDGTAATSPRHPVPGEDPTSCTPQNGPGLWSERLTHFRAGTTPSVGAEVQSEFFVDRVHALDAIARLRAIGEDLAQPMMVSEIRTVRRDDLWLSPQYERDCVAFHFTWHHDLAAAERAAQMVASALAPLQPLPHWGKVFDPTQFDFAALYPMLADWTRLAREWDPTGTFSNRWMHETFD